MNWVVGSNLFLTGRGGTSSQGFQLAKRAAWTRQVFIDDDEGASRNEPVLGTDRPQDTISATPTSFKGRHEVKFGFGWRKATVESTRPSRVLDIVDLGPVGYPISLIPPIGTRSNTRTLHERLCRRHDVARSPDANLAVRIDNANLIGAATGAGDPIVPDVLPA